MFNILYRSSLRDYDIVQGSTDIFKAGTVVTFCDNRKVTVCNDLSIPAGFLINDSGGDFICSTYDFNRVSVCGMSGEYQTDLYEGGEYKINDLLYCSSNGKITNDPYYSGNIIIGVVNFVENGVIGFNSCLARGLELTVKTPMNKLNRFEMLKNG